MLASAGFGSRRQCEELIEAGRVEIDGELITQLGTTVDPQNQKVKVDGVPLKKQKLVYYAVNKPVGVVTTNRDPQGRPRVVDLVPPDERVFPVGRLDRSSDGLILLTNDGELAQKLTHPKFGIRKVYRVTVAGKVDGETMKKMRQGVYIAEGFVKVEGARLLKTRSRATEMEIILREGKNREIRRILARLGHKVQTLRRIAVGPLRLGDLPAGAYRVVTPQEVEKLWRATETAAEGESQDGRAPTWGAKKRRGKVPGARYGSGRRPAKKSRPAKEAELPISLGSSPSSGIIIGGDPAPGERKPKSGRGGSSKRTDRNRAGGGRRSGSATGNTASKKHASKTGRRKSGTGGAPKGSQPRGTRPKGASPKRGPKKRRNP